MVNPTFLTTLLPSPPSRQSISSKDDYRRYISNLDVRCNIRGRTRYVNVPIQYEVGMRSVYVDGGTFKRKVWVSDVQGGTLLPALRYPVSDSIRTLLDQRKYKYTLPPLWHDFNFDRIVCTLAAMLGVLSLKGDMSTVDFRGGPWNIRAMNQAGDTFAVNDSGCVYLDQLMAPNGHRAALWAMACAANIAGCEVTLPAVDCDARGCPIGVELYGGELIRGATLALNILASYYNICGVGDAFAVSVTKGLHSCLSVVAHSDEGGLMRDLLRRCDFVPSFGGVPAGLPLCGTFPVDDALCAGSIVSMVDALLLASAATVAHCDPMVCEQGRLYPTVISARCVTGPDGVTPLTEGEMKRHMAQLLAAEFSGFATLYAGALASLYGLQAGSCGTVGAQMLCAMATSLSEVGSRHTKERVLAPFFWIEPTSILPHDMYGTLAEQGGSGSLATRDGPRQVPLFTGLEAVGVGNMFRSDWAMDYRSARTTPFVWFALNNIDDGLGHLSLKSFDSDNIVLASLGADEIRRRKVDNDGIHLSEMMWKRGQSKLPHPAEVLYTDGRVGFTILHHKVDAAGYCIPLKHIPLFDEMLEATLTIRAGAIAVLDNGKNNLEPSTVKRLRTRGLQALERAMYEYYSAGRCIESGVRVSERPPPPKSSGKLPPSQFKGAPHEDLAPEDSGQPTYNAGHTRTTGHPAPSRDVAFSMGPAPQPACQQGAVTCPKPHFTAGGGAVGVGPPSAGGACDGGDGGVQPPHGADGGANVAAVNQQLAGPAARGAAPKC